LPRLPNALRDAFLREKPFITVDEYVTVKCPACGRVDQAQERRFFGIFGPSAVRFMVALIVGAVLVAVGFVIVREFARFVR
jgi:hypothetical protein